jgi:hypothetical protein
MKIKIKPSTSGEPVITNALLEANGKATGHVATPQDIIDAAKDAENQLQQLGIGKSGRIGAEFIYMSGGSVSKSYKYQRAVNVITAVRGGSDWFVTGIRKTTIWPQQCGSLKIGLTAEQERIALNQVRSKFYTITLA